MKIDGEAEIYSERGSNFMKKGRNGASSLANSEGTVSASSTAPTDITWHNRLVSNCSYVDFVDD